jgi:prephenate dehydrogenase
MKTRFQRVAIIGVGLLGGSLGLALKQHGLAAHVVGIGRRQASLNMAKDVGAIDETFLDVRQGAAGADLIAICTPAQDVIHQLDTLRDAVDPETIVTDVASTKASICAHATATWPQPLRFIGSHPMAGSEKFGPAHARADLYEGSVCLVETNELADPVSRDQIVALWEGVGARVVNVSPEEHDAILARTSHLPHVAAAAVALAAIRCAPDSAMVGPGFRDTTRVADGRAELWRDICLTNRDALLEGLEDLQQTLHDFQSALEHSDSATLEQLFQDGREARRKVLGS